MMIPEIFWEQLVYPAKNKTNVNTWHHLQNDQNVDTIFYIHMTIYSYTHDFFLIYKTREDQCLDHSMRIINLSRSQNKVPSGWINSNWNIVLKEQLKDM